VGKNIAAAVGGRSTEAIIEMGEGVRISPSFEEARRGTNATSMGGERKQLERNERQLGCK
jgi:hypothetical protein